MHAQDDDFEASDEEEDAGRPVTNAKELAGMKVGRADEAHAAHAWLFCFSSNYTMRRWAQLRHDAG
jgi:hypothetical protein